MRAAIMSISRANDEFTADLNSLDKKLRELSERFYGDNVKGRLELDAPPSIFGRLNNALYDGYGSTGEPTTTMKSQFKNAGDQFEGWYSELKTILNTDLKNLEIKLEAAGAPYTPGRVPEWRKN